MSGFSLCVSSSHPVSGSDISHIYLWELDWVPGSVVDCIRTGRTVDYLGGALFY